MMTLPAAARLQWQTVLRFLLAMAAGNLLWEVAHMPLYTLWLTGSRSEIVYAVLHCTAGDVMIAGVSLLLALAVVGRGAWPLDRYQVVALTMMVLALGYTLFSEWLNTEVRGSWTYRETMPRLPLLGTGLTPVLQWIIVPALAFRLVRPRGGA